MIWALLACQKDAPPPVGDSSAEQALQRDVVASLGENVVIPWYREVESRARALVQAGEAFCASPADPGLLAFRSAWSDTRGAWKKAEIVRFGPAVEEPYRLQPKIDSWPANPAAIEAYLSGEGGFTQEDFDGMGSATRGLPALEVLLWTPGDQALAVFLAEPRRCPYALGLASDLEVLAGRMVTAWETDWNDRLVHPEDHPEDAYQDLQDVIDEWVNRMAFTVEDIRSTKLGKPVGDTSGGEPLPDTLESRYSGRSLLDSRDALTGVRTVAEDGIFELIPSGKSEIATKIERAQGEAEAYLSEIREPLEDAIVEDRLAIGAAQEALLTLQVLLQVDLAQALSVTLAFNDNDGD